MIWDIANLILGAFIGTIFSLVLPLLYKRVREQSIKKKIERRRKILSDRERVYGWLLKYQEKNGDSRDLFDCRIGNLEVKIPFLTKDEWQYSATVPFEEDFLFEYAEAPSQDFEVDLRKIEMRRRMGQKLWDEPTLYLDRLVEQEDSVILRVNNCQYFQMATRLIQLEEETFGAIEKGTFKNLGMRNSNYSSTSKAQQQSVKPFSVGCAVALAMRTENSYEFLIHTRSHATISFGGAKAVIPNFGMAPIPPVSESLVSCSTSSSDIGSHSNLLYYNFIREFLEELYNYEKVTSLVNDSRTNPFWFYKRPQVQALIQLIHDGKFSLKFLGVGFEALNGTAIVGLLGIFHDIESSVKFKQSVLALNWESHKGERLEVVDRESPELEMWLRNNQLNPAAAFTIALALKHLESLQP